MVYNITGIVSGNETTLLTLIQGVNTNLMDGWLGILFLIGISIVFFISIVFTTNDPGKAAIATSFISFSLALSMLAFELIPPLALFITLILTATMVAISWPKS